MKNLPLGLQPKLLRFLQEGEVHVLGERAPRRVNVRIVAATHKELLRAISENTFREDLYYRVAALSLHVLPLRERPEDIAALISHFLTHYARRNDRPIAGITAEAISVLQGYAWPGNARELAAEIERLVLYTDEGAYIGVEHISPRIRPAGSGATAEGAAPAAADLERLMEDFERRVITENAQRANDYNGPRRHGARPRLAPDALTRAQAAGENVGDSYGRPASRPATPLSAALKSFGVRNAPGAHGPDSLQ